MLLQASPVITTTAEIRQNNSSNTTSVYKSFAFSFTNTFMSPPYSQSGGSIFNPDRQGSARRNVLEPGKGLATARSRNNCGKQEEQGHRAENVQQVLCNLFHLSLKLLVDRAPPLPIGRAVSAAPDPFRSPHLRLYFLFYFLNIFLQLAYFV